MRRPYRRHLIQNIIQQAHTALDITPVSISAMIAAVAQKLINDVAIGSMDFHAIETRSFCQLGAVLELRYNASHFVQFKSARHHEILHAVIGHGLAFGLDG